MNTEKDVIVIGDLGEDPTKTAAVVLEDDDAPKLPKHATLQDDGSVKLPLRKKVTLVWSKGGAETSEEFTELTMRRLTGKDMKDIGAASRGDAATTAIACSASIPFAKFRHVFERMDAADVNAAGEVVNYFLNSGPTTGR